MRNEYESKIYELNDDINYLHKELKKQEINFGLNARLNTSFEDQELIQDLNEKNQILLIEKKAVIFKF